MPSLDVPNRLGLKPVLSFHSEVVHVQHVPAGEGIGYGSTYVTPEPMTIATIPVGYADGYPRSLSNRGTVLIHGTRCPVVGRICMDQFMVAVPDTITVKPGDKVVLLGSQGHESISHSRLPPLPLQFLMKSFVVSLSAYLANIYKILSIHTKFKDSI